MIKYNAGNFFFFFGKRKRKKEKDDECSRRNNQPLHNYSLALFFFFGISNKELMQEYNQKLFQYFILDF